MTRILRVITAAVVVLTGLVSVSAQSRDADITAFFKAYDAAFNASDIQKLATMYHADVTIFEGSGINRGWVDYRDNHLGPELKSFQDLQWAHSNIVVHMLGDASAYVTADYTIKYKTATEPWIPAASRRTCW